MLLEFSVGNFLSFKTKTTLSLAATSIKEYRDTNIIATDRWDLLKGVVIYGANASGKSNFIRALATMRRLVRNSFDQSSTDELEITPFMLNTETEKAPSFFEVVIIIDNIRYRYGFEVDKRVVHAEWLFEARKNVEKPLFLRIGDGIEVGKNFSEGKGLEERTRDNALFLTVVDQFNGRIAKNIIQWFDQFTSLAGFPNEEAKRITFQLLKDKETRSKMVNFYKKLDLGIDDIVFNNEIFDTVAHPNVMSEIFVEQLVSDIEVAYQRSIITKNIKYNNQRKAVGYVEFDLRNQGSSGMNKLTNISGAIFSILNKGGVLVIDELDTHLHSLFTLALTKLFNSNQSNPKNAQLIFTAHDTNLLSYGNFRRDQIYFIEKDLYGASEMYSLVEYKEEGKTIRKDRSFEKDYIDGRYGAIPYVDDLSNVVMEWQEK